jgi:hypothetical protein
MVGIYMMTNYKFVMDRIEVINFDHRLRAWPGRNILARTLRQSLFLTTFIQTTIPAQKLVIVLTNRIPGTSRSVKPDCLPV